MVESTKSWVKVCAFSQLPTDKPKDVNINGQRLIIARCGDGAQIMQGFCTHMLYPLSQGKINNCELTCALHHSKFDIRDGKVIEWSTYPSLMGPALAALRERKGLRTFETRVTDGDVYVLWPADDPKTVRVRV
jgi:3-phenylpropionate/trans-cinnamate dioxygenase ferredoxin subunit